MSKLDELIKKYCPDGVEYNALDEVIISLNTGLNPRKFFKLNTNDAKNYYITIREIHNNKIQITDSTDKINDDALRLCNNRSNLDKGDILFSGTGTIGEIALIEDKPYNWNIKEGVYAIKPIQKMIISKYLMYILQTDTIRTAYMKKVAGGTVKSIPMKDLKKITIPVPPLPVQEEIVRILDSFTSLTAELQAELQARKKQYEYYRHKLLTNIPNAQIVELRNVVKKSTAGGTPKKGMPEFYDHATIPWIRTQDVHFNEITKVNSYITEIAVQKTSAKWIPENCVIVAISGASAGRCAINKIKATTNQHCLNLEIDSTKAIYKYIYYCIYDQFNELISLKQGARGDLNSSLILGIKIPVPSLKEQKRIINILDRFDRLCNDITTGLPAEIAARQKQYEYYRDKLLTFKKLS